MQDVPILVCTAGTQKGSQFDVPEGGLKIGRADDNDIVLKEDGVSRLHAMLIFDNGSLWLRDAGSRNGMFVNEHRVTGHRALKVGDQITISEHTFTVCWQSEPLAEDEPTEEIDPSQDRRNRWFWPFSG
jgi:pSer/pThr/pTyr-binding forkhead associated (FHA) protein